MAVATIKLVQNESMFKFYFATNPETLAQEFLAQGLYKEVPAFEVDGEGNAAAEEVFDLTNNPNRQEEREMVYGRGRSVSVGDIVNVDGVNYLCASIGWIVI